MQSDLEGPVNIGNDERVTVADWVRTVIEVSGKRIKVKYVPGPVGCTPVTLRQGSGHRFSKARIKSLGWQARYSLKEGIARVGIFSHFKVCFDEESFVVTFRPYPW